MINDVFWWLFHLTNSLLWRKHSWTSRWCRPFLCFISGSTDWLDTRCIVPYFVGRYLRFTVLCLHIFWDAVSGTNFSSSPSRWHNCRNVLVTSLEICGALCSRFYFGTLPCRFSPFLRLFGNRIRKQRLLMPSTRGFKEDNYRDLETVCWKTRTCHLHPSTFKVVYLYVRLRVIICVV
jgi:hypothetical protein